MTECQTTDTIHLGYTMMTFRVDNTWSYRVLLFGHPHGGGGGFDSREEARTRGEKMLSLCLSSPGWSTGSPRRD